MTFSVLRVKIWGLDERQGEGLGAEVIWRREGLKKHSEGPQMESLVRSHTPLIAQEDRYASSPVFRRGH